MARAKLLVSAALGLVVALCSVAEAQPSQTRLLRPKEGKQFIDVGVGIRFPITTSMNEKWDGHLNGYGYDPSVAAFGLQVSAGHAVLPPMLDVGVSADYWYHSEGVSPGSRDRMSTHARMLGAFVRPHMRSPRGVVDVGVRLEAGVVSARTTLRGESIKELSKYGRFRMEVTFGRGVVRARLHFSFTAVGGYDDYEPYVPPKLGGVAFGAGVSSRF